MKKLAIQLLVSLFVLALISVGIFFLLDTITGSDVSDTLLNRFKDESSESASPEMDLQIELNTEQREVLEVSSTSLVRSNYPITTDSSRLELQLLEESEGSYSYILKISNIGIGSSDITVELFDEFERNLEFQIPITRRRIILPYGANEIEPWPNTNYIANPDDLLVKVNKTNRFSSDYEPAPLVNVSEDLLLYANSEDIQIREDAGAALKAMLTDMQNDIGKNVVVASGYRSYNNQLETYAGWVSTLGQEGADAISAKPGYSEHQSGLVVDFFNEETDFQFTEKFDETSSGKWLLENAHLYGFVQSYPKGSEAITGYSYEAWQYRFIGQANAEAWFVSGVSFPEWIVQFAN